MDRSFYVEALAMADRHVARGHEIIDNQRRTISKLKERGVDSTLAESLLATILATQDLHEDDWRRFSNVINKLGDADADRT